jgi:hypothetical protein
MVFYSKEKVKMERLTKQDVVATAKKENNE